MTRRVWLPVAAGVAVLFGLGLWAVRAVQDLGRAFADVVNGR